MKYQTKIEVAETESKITNLESKVKESERNIKVFKDEKSSALDKIKKLKKQKININKGDMKETLSKKSTNIERTSSELRGHEGDIQQLFLYPRFY